MGQLHVMNFNNNLTPASQAKIFVVFFGVLLRSNAKRRGGNLVLCARVCYAF
jgi:hypothetical protein